MGPLIEPGAVDRYMKFIGISSREGGELVMRGKMLDLETKGNYVTPTLSWVKDSSIEHAQKSVSQQTELFAPLLTVLSSNDLDHAIALANATDRANYERCFEDLEVGLVNWNRGTIGASSRLPFGGIKKSGNHFPTALSATRYCTAPISALEVEKPVLAGPGVYPGLT
jgi:succinylglutamic semialdehyde dehydrogenase